jgi:hypothetical protein
MILLSPQFLAEHFLPLADVCASIAHSTHYQQLRPEHGGFIPVASACATSLQPTFCARLSVHFTVPSAPQLSSSSALASEKDSPVTAPCMAEAPQHSLDKPCSAHGTCMPWPL